jgi:hypothetical protein
MKNLLFFLLPFFSLAQEDFKELDSSQQVRIRLEIIHNEAFFRFLQLPESAEFSVLYLESLNGDCFTGIRLEPSLLGMQALRIDLGDNCTSSDTLLLRIDGQYNHFDYPPFLFLPGSYYGNLGENCYVLSCIPQNDPWMPHAEQPYLLSEDLHYLNPKNGKIYRGKRLIHYGRFDACDLEGFHQINSYAKYYDKNNVMYLGSELIKKKKIDLKDWDLGGF